MATYRRTAKAAPSIVSFEFDYYDEAVAFRSSMAAMNPSNPFKKGSRWLVSMVNHMPKSAPAVKVEDWKKPGVYLRGKLAYSSYDDHKSVETPLPVEVTEDMLGDMVEKAQQAKMHRVTWTALPKYVYEQAHSGR
jgi:hypothetical protein